MNAGDKKAGPAEKTEDALRQRLKSSLQTLRRREPLEPTYKRLLLNNGRLANPPILPRDKFYRKINSDIRAQVENFLAQTAGKDPMDRIAQRQPLEESSLRAAFTLREAKEHEQQALLDATLAAFPKRNGMDGNQRKRYLEEIALGLQSREKKKIHVASHQNKKQHPQQPSEWERQRDQARVREEARRRREEEDVARRRRESRKADTPQQGLYRYYHPIFKRLWDMEFHHLGGINPFRTVIDRENCASVGAPDYFDVIDKPMNLTYIQQKVEAMKYDNLKSFFEDVELMLKNAFLYNTDPSNPYRKAAEDMKKMYVKLKMKLFETIEQKQKK